VDEVLLRASARIRRRIPQVGTGNVTQYMIDISLAQPARQLANHLALGPFGTFAP
jgi:hypothetical protein